MSVNRSWVVVWTCVTSVSAVSIHRDVPTLTTLCTAVCCQTTTWRSVVAEKQGNPTEGSLESHGIRQFFTQNPCGLLWHEMGGLQV